MTLSKRMVLIVALLIIALVSAACGGGGDTPANTDTPADNNTTDNNTTDNNTTTTQSASAEDVARAWFNALFMGDGATLRANTCAAQLTNITDEAIAALEAGLVGGATINTDAVTFAVTDGIVTIGGTMGITMTVGGTTQSTDVPMTDFPINNFPIVQEDGAWKVCADLVGSL